MALGFTPNKMRNGGRIWSTAVWSLTAEGVSGISVERCGQHGTKTVGGRASPIRGCYHKTGEKPGSLNHYDGCQRWRGLVKLRLSQGSLVN